MENQIQIFSNTDFGAIRTIRDEQSSEPWFCAVDVCNALGYAAPRNAVSRHVDEGDALKRCTPTSSGIQEMLFVNESGLYSLMILSKLPQAKRFKRWVTSEVLPSIRKHGAYMSQETAQRGVADPSYLVAIANQLKDESDHRKALERELEEKKRSLHLAGKEIGECQEALRVKEHVIDDLQSNVKSLNVELDELKPKVYYYEQLLGSEDLLCASNISSEYDMRADQFNLMLADYGIFNKQKKGDQWVLRNEYLNKGLTQTATYVYYNKKGEARVRTSPLTKWTQFGHHFLYVFLKARGVLPTAERPKEPTLFDNIQ